jgi:hypothetical protein
MIPRAVEQIFDYCTALESKGWRYTLEAMYVEIHNEAIHDLLTDAASAEAVHEIKHHGVGAQAGKEPQVQNPFRHICCRCVHVCKSLILGVQDLI